MILTILFNMQTVTSMDNELLSLLLHVKKGRCYSFSKLVKQDDFWQISFNEL